MTQWKNNLDELNEIPGETGFDKPAAWEKLHNRMEEKQPRTKLFWYSIAAACLAAIAVAGWLMNDPGKNPGIVKGNGAVFPQTITKEIAPADIKNETYLTPLPVQNDQPNTVAIEKKKSIAVIIQKNIVTPLVPDTVEQVTTGPIAIAQNDNVILKNDSNLMKTDVVIVPVKKKLKVVHFNEVNTTFEEQIEFNRTQARSTSKQKRTGKSNLFNSSFGNTQSGDDFIKIKLSPQN